MPSGRLAENYAVKISWMKQFILVFSVNLKQTAEDKNLFLTIILGSIRVRTETAKRTHDFEIYPTARIARERTRSTV